MDDAVILRGKPISLGSNEWRELVIDGTRAGENLISDDDLRAKYELSAEDWANITRSTALARAVRAESERRIYHGIAAREAAAKIHSKAPAVLGEILQDKAASPRHRIESARELRSTATGPAGNENVANSGAVFLIQINLNGDIETYEKTIEPAKQISTTNNDKGDGNEW